MIVLNKIAFILNIIESKDQTKKKDIIQDKYSKILEGMEELWEEDQYTKEY